jgi:transcriptional regulator with XRE-family HTH domain
MNGAARDGRKGWISMVKTVSYAQWAMEPYAIGPKLRALRTQKRLTLARLAAETGLSTALLSKLETNRMIPTLPTLATISRVYGVGMSHFFHEPTRHTLSITRKAHLQGYERGMEQMKVMPLNAAATHGAAHGGKDVPSGEKGSRAHRRTPRLVAQMVELAANGSVCLLECTQQASGLIYVLEGNLQLVSGGLEEHLDAGDCAYVESDMALMGSAAGKHRCRVLAVFPAAEGTE